MYTFADDCHYDSYECDHGTAAVTATMTQVFDVRLIQEMLNKAVCRAAAAPVHTSSTAGASFTPCFSRSANVCGGRGAARRLKPRRDGLISGHLRLLNQDNSTAGRLTSEDMDKGRDAKKTDAKKHKQVVWTFST